MTALPTKLAILAGGGTLPESVAQACLRDGIPFLAINPGGAAGAWIEQHNPLNVALGQVGLMLDTMKAEGCDAITMAGPLARPQLSKVRFDWQGAKMLPRLAKLFRRGDDALLSGIAGLFEENGFRVIGPEVFLKEAVATAGSLSNNPPTSNALTDVAHAREILNALGPLDVGQAVVVADGVCLAIEAAEGTARMLNRVEEMARSGLPSGVLVKLPKPDQDRRVDLPTIGPETARAAARAGLAGIAIEAGSGFILERDETVRLCNEAGLFLIGLESSG